MEIKHGLLPARHVVDAFGGVRSLSRELNLSPSTVSRWMAPDYLKGTNGRIPQRYWPELLRLARARRVRLTVQNLAGL